MSHRTDTKTALDLAIAIAMWKFRDLCEAKGGILACLERCDFKAVGVLDEIEQASEYGARVCAPLADLPRARVVDALTHAQILQMSSAGWRVELLSHAEWVEQGFPTVEVGHKLAASMMATGVPSDVAKSLEVPWSGFCIRVPRGLLTCGDMNSSAERSPIAQVFVVAITERAMGEPEFAFLARSDSGVSLWNRQPNLFELLTGDSELKYATLGPFDEKLDSLDDRNAELVRRLVAGVLIEMGDPRAFAKVGRGHRLYEYEHAKREQRRSPIPVVRNYRLTRKVVHDVRPAVIAYGTGTGRKLTVQSIVAGHWKRQAYGPRSALRKIIHVEPYWRGDEDAPIAVRSHVLKGRE